MSQGMPAAAPLRLLLVCQSPLLLAGLEVLLVTEIGAQIQAVHSWDEAERLATAVPPDVLVVETAAVATIQTPLVRLCTRLPHTPLLIVGRNEPEEFLLAVRIGARGFVGRHVEASAFGAAVRATAAGGWALPRELLGHLVAAFRASHEERAALAPTVGTRERQVLDRLVGGMAIRQIAATLYLSESTVRRDLTRLMQRFGATNRVQLVAMALRERVTKRDCGETTPGSPEA